MTSRSPLEIREEMREQYADENEPRLAKEDAILLLILGGAAAMFVIEYIKHSVWIHQLFASK